MTGNGKPKPGDALVSLLETLTAGLTRIASTVSAQSVATQEGFNAIAERIGVLQTVISTLAESLARLDGRVVALEEKPDRVDARARDRP